MLSVITPASVHAAPGEAAGYVWGVLPWGRVP